VAGFGAAAGSEGVNGAVVIICFEPLFGLLVFITAVHMGFALLGFEFYRKRGCRSRRFDNGGGRTWIDGSRSGSEFGTACLLFG
jgi:hypothetical protein